MATSPVDPSAKLKLSASRPVQLSASRLVYPATATTQRWACGLMHARKPNSLLVSY